MPTAIPEMMLVAGTLLGCVRDVAHRSVGAGVVLRDEEERERGDETDDSADRELEASVRQHPEADDEHGKPQRRRDRDEEAPVQLAHRIRKVAARVER